MGAAVGRGRPARGDRRVAGAALRPEHPAAPGAHDEAGHGRRRARARQQLSGRWLSRVAPRDRRLCGRRARERRPRRGRRRPDPSLRAGLRGTGRHDRDPGGPDLPALPDRRAARRRASNRLLLEHCGFDLRLPAEQPDRHARRDPGRAATRRRRGVLRVQRRDRALADRRRRDRAPHLLEAVRARRCAHRLRTRVRRRRCGAERAPGARARVDDLGRARARRARRSARRRAGARGARAVRRRAARARLHAARVARELPLRPGRRRARGRGHAAEARDRRAGVAGRVSCLRARPRGRRRAARGARRRGSYRRPHRAHGARDRRDTLHHQAAARRGAAHPRLDRRRDL